MQRTLESVGALVITVEMTAQTFLGKSFKTQIAGVSFKLNIALPVNRQFSILKRLWVKICQAMRAGNLSSILRRLVVTVATA